MARFLYGAGGDGDIIKPTGLPYINAAANVYNARTGGVQVTDLQDATGHTIAAVTSDANGQVLFYGPDSFIGVLWLDFGSGVRWALSPKAVDLAATQAIAVQRAADAAALSYTAKAHLPYNANDPLEQSLTTALDPLVIQRFNSDAARDAAFPTPQAGDRCYRTDLYRDQIYDAVAGVWIGLVGISSWSTGNYNITPTSGTFTLGSGTGGLKFRTTGKAVTFYLWLTFASDTSPGTGTWTLTLPFSVSTNSILNIPVFGHAYCGSNRVPLLGQFETATTMSLWAVTSTTNTTISRIGTTPCPGSGTNVWTSGNFIRLSGTLEAA